MKLDLSPDLAQIYRITHVVNVPWILDHGLHCRTARVRDPNFREIGSPDLIAKRVRREVPERPRGTLADYVPFYFTPRTPMQLNITTGYMGTPLTPASEIAILVSSIHRLDQWGHAYLITDRHAYLQAARFSTDATGLANLDWALLQSGDFKRSDTDPGRVERYQAEALVHRHVPVNALVSVAVRDAAAQAKLIAEWKSRGLSLPLAVRPEWYCR